jgi:transcriptional regulator with XRE-family HTH domain
MAGEGIGARLRSARERTGWSLRSVASAVGVSPSLLSQVETGKTNPSVSTLFALIEYLGSSTEEVLGASGTSAVLDPRSSSATPSASIVLQRGADNPIVPMEDGVVWERLASQPGGAAESLLVTYPPHGASSSGGELMRHPGTEHVYLLEGKLTLQFEQQTHVLSAGDSMLFDSARPHFYVNEGAVPARGIWFIVAGRDSTGAPSSH